MSNKIVTTEIEAATFRRLIKHLDEHKEVQNIDLMITAKFCRNCLSKWYQSAALKHEVAINYEQSREVIYGMTYKQWKDKYQTPAATEQLDVIAKKT